MARCRPDSRRDPNDLAPPRRRIIRCLASTCMPVRFTSLDLLVVVCYFAVTIGIGLYFRKKSRSVEGFTAAARNQPGWLLGVSIVGTYVSSISFLALPGK